MIHEREKDTINAQYRDKNLIYADRMRANAMRADIKMLQ